MIERLEACVLPVSDLARSREFYQEILGFDLVEAVDDELVILRAGESEVVLLSPEATANEPKFEGAVPGGAVAIHFRVGDPERLFELLSQTVPILEKPGERRYGDWDFTIQDPDGYRLVFGRAIHS